MWDWRSVCTESPDRPAQSKAAVQAFTLGNSGSFGQMLCLSESFLLSLLNEWLGCRGSGNLCPHGSRKRIPPRFFSGG